MQTAPSSGTWGECSVSLVEQMIGLMWNMTMKVMQVLSLNLMEDIDRGDLEFV
jgi:hypothetical protein